MPTASGSTPGGLWRSMKRTSVPTEKSITDAKPRRELLRPPEALASRLGPLAALSGKGADQRPLELREAAQDSEHELTVRVVVSAQVSLSERKPAPA
jgi:hypothetical protein